jgi:S-methylmethionine-dependent homocysteine/selenocysteine methylase
LAKKWFRLGATWIGGCCGTGPSDIRRVKAVRGNSD